MKIKPYFLIILFLFIAPKAFAIPRCDQFYQSIYNDTRNTDVFLDTQVEKKDIGIRLSKFWNENARSLDFLWPQWDLETNKNGYFIVGKITKPINSIKVGDVILSINDVDLRDFSEDPDKKKMLIDNVSEFFDDGAEMKFEISRKVNDKIKIFIINNKIGKDWADFLAEKNKPMFEDHKIFNTIENYDEPYLDFFINSLDMNEKEGNFTASIETSFQENLDDRYYLTNRVWENLIYDKKFNDNGMLASFKYEYCTYQPERWKTLNTVDPAVGLRFDNVIKEDKNTKTSEYTVSPAWSNVARNKGYQQDEAYIKYTSNSTYTFKNKFNLKSFPFDKQKVKIYLYNERHNINHFKALLSDYTEKRALEFKELNNVEGWNIVDVKTSYEFHKDPNVDDDHDGISVIFELERKSGYYIFKVILPIILILIVCWSAVWINPKEIESRLTITIVCLLSLIAYNFVIDSEMPKLEYLTIMDYIVLISYIYATIPNFLSIAAFNLIGKNKKLCQKYENYGKRYGLLSYLMFILLTIVVNTNSSPEHTNAMLSWIAPR